MKCEGERPSFRPPSNEINGLRLEITSAYKATHSGGEMSDIMERLLQPCSSNDANRQRKEAAAEIERLQALLKEYEEHAESYWTAKVERLRVERDELLAALERIVAHDPKTPGLYYDSLELLVDSIIETACAHQMSRIARAAIAKAEDGK